MKHVALPVIFLLVLQNLIAQSYKNPSEIKSYKIKSAGGWDYIAVNNKKIYVSHGTQVNILDEMSGDSLGFIPSTIGVHGIAFDNDLHRGYTSNGRTNDVLVFDLNSNDTIQRIATGQNPDAILYEPYSKTIITCNGRSKDLSVIDPKENKVIETIPVGGKPEAAVSDAAGKLYINIEDKDEIVVVDVRSWSAIKHFSLLPGKSPTGLAIDASTKRLFASCDKLLVIVNAETGGMITQLPIGDGCDGVAFDDFNKTIFTSNGEGSITAIKEATANEYASIGNYSSKRGARTITIDQQTHVLFLPTAEFSQPTTAGERAKMIPGTFQVLAIKL